MDKNDDAKTAKVDDDSDSKSDASTSKSTSDASTSKNDSGGRPAGDVSASPHGFMVSLVVCALALAAGETMYRRSTLPAAIRPTDVYMAKVDDYTRRGGADVVVVGSSRIYHGANAPMLSQLATDALGKSTTVYNMGVPAGDLPGYVLTVEDVLRKGLKKPSLFVFGMSPIEWTCCPATSLPSSAKWVSAIRPRHAWALFSSASDGDEAFTDLTIGLFQSYGARTHVLNEVRYGKRPEGFAGTGNLGWVSFGWPIDPASQNARATGRAEAYRPNFYAPKHFDRAGTHRYFVRAMERLEAAGVRIAIIGTPQARQLDRNNDAAGYYPEYVRYLTEQAAAHGTVFVNFNDFPGLTNADFGDGDHLVEPGAAKFSRLLAAHVIVPALQGAKPSSP